MAIPALTLTNLDRVLWPEVGFTKRDMIDYYVAVAPWLLPQVRDRPVTLARFPQGVDGRGWYQTNCRGAPDWMATAEVEGRHGATFRMCLINDVDALTWVANQGTLELHPLLAPFDDPEHPLELVFDLDPGPQAGLVSCARVALAVRRMLEADGLDGWVKTSGSVGLHLIVPLDGSATFAQTRRYARAVAATLTAELPTLVTDIMQMQARLGRVLIDWRQNEPMRSMIAPFSLRATPWPLVAMPLSWDEVAAVARMTRRPAEVVFGPAQALARIQQRTVSPSRRRYALPAPVSE